MLLNHFTFSADCVPTPTPEDLFMKSCEYLLIKPTAQNRHENYGIYSGIYTVRGYNIQLSIILVAILYLLISESSHTIIKCEFGTCLSISLELSSCYVLTSSSLSYLCELEYSQFSI